MKSRRVGALLGNGSNDVYLSFGNKRKFLATVNDCFRVCQSTDRSAKSMLPRAPARRLHSSREHGKLPTCVTEVLFDCIDKFYVMLYNVIIIFLLCRCHCVCNRTSRHGHSGGWRRRWIIHRIQTVTLANGIIVHQISEIYYTVALLFKALGIKPQVSRGWRTPPPDTGTDEIVCGGGRKARGLAPVRSSQACPASVAPALGSQPPKTLGSPDRVSTIGSGTSEYRQISHP